MKEYQFLSKDILAKASLRGNEYAWKPEDVKGVIKDAESKGLANLGGQAQFRLYEGSTCEMYWIEIDPRPRGSDESWNDYVKRTAAEILNKFEKVMKETDFRKEAESFKEVDCKSHLDSLCFVLYFESSNSK